ncbi:MAG: porin, partial [Proteobacteria bacterium]|nr:porin [Pseudomonadota bacterium]
MNCAAVTFRSALILMASTLLPGAAAYAADAAGAGAGSSLEQRLEQQVEQMQQQLDAMKAQLQQLKAQNEALAAQQAAQTAQAQMTATTTPSNGIADNLSLWGYGEVYYTHPTHNGALTQFDLARAVFGIGYRFDDRTVFNSEYEIEHGVASADDAGEFEVEQFYIDHQLADWASLKAGLFLIPAGLLNEHHEPTNFYGVQRNFVETLIIPSTWREGGLALHGNTPGGLSWDVGLTTGMNLGGWDINPEDPQYRTALDLINSGAGPLQATHQELSLANGQNLSQYLSLNFSGVPGLLAGASVFTGKAALP